MNYSIGAENARIDKLASKLPRDCAVFYVAAATSANEEEFGEQNSMHDAMLVSVRRHVPTLNGRSGKYPRGLVVAQYQSIRVRKPRSTVDSAKSNSWQSMPAGNLLRVDSSAERQLISVIMIFLNERRFIEEAIRSVLAQTHQDWELLLIDDGSTDGSSEIARSIAAKYPAKVRYLEHAGHQNLGNERVAEFKGAVRRKAP